MHPKLFPTGPLDKGFSRRGFLRGAGTGLGLLAMLKAEVAGEEQRPQPLRASNQPLTSNSPSSRTIALSNCNLIDGVSDTPRLQSGILLEKGRISEVGQPGKRIETRSVEVIDCGGAWVLPGLWDVHVHLQFPEITPPKDHALRTIRYGLNAIEGLRDAGITSIRTAGVDNWIDVAWREIFKSGELIGPRIFAGGHFLTTTAGHGHGQPFAIEANGADNFLRAVREEIQKGVDHIKLNLSGGIMGPPWDRHWHNFFLPEELEAVFRLCNLRGYKVMAHATNPTSVKEAIRLGAWSIEHGYQMDDECIQMLLAKKVIYVPTLGVSHLTPRQVTNEWEKRFMATWESQIPAEFFARADQAVDEHKKTFQTALKAGVRLALGSDLGPLKDGTFIEMGLWIRDGATPMQVIKAATKTAAETCGVENELGTIEKGKVADLVVVKDNPLSDINNLRTLQMVFKEGALVVDKRGSC